MRTGSKTPGLRIVGGTAFGSAGTETGSLSEPVFRRSEPGCAEGGSIQMRPRRRVIAPPATETARNARLREQRRHAWRAAEAATRYWRVRMKFDDAIEQARRMGIPEGRYHPISDPEGRQSFEDHQSLVARWRSALAQQFLTPAPDTAAVKWKQGALAARDYEYTGVKADRLERAIADDLAWLTAHPMRQSKRGSAVAND